jgi:hypothetical protein
MGRGAAPLQSQKGPTATRRRAKTRRLCEKAPKFDFITHNLDCQTCLGTPKMNLAANLDTSCFSRHTLDLVYLSLFQLLCSVYLPLIQLSSNEGLVLRSGKSFGLSARSHFSCTLLILRVLIVQPRPTDGNHRDFAFDLIITQLRSNFPRNLELCRGLFTETAWLTRSN